MLGNKRVWLLLFVLLLLTYPLIIGKSGYFMTIFVMIMIYSIGAMALNLLIGYGGQISVGHAGFLAIGAYTAAILSSKFGFPFLVALPLAGVVTGIVGLVIGLPAIRLSGQFLAVATLGFGLSVPQLALNWNTLTNGYSGLALSRPSLMASDSQFIYAVIIITIFITWLLYNILKSRMGRAFVAIRESEIAAQATGIDLSFYKTIMFVISAFFTGLAGGLYAYWIGFVSPNDFTMVTSFLLLGMIVVGGLASIPGAVIGAIIFTVIPELTSSFIGLTNLVLGCAIFLIILFLPKGLVSGLGLLQGKRKSRLLVGKNKEGKVLKSGGVAKDVNV